MMATNRRKSARAAGGTPTPDGFTRMAREFVLAAQLVLNRASSVLHPAYFLLGRSIELLLKAYLLDCHVAIDVLRHTPYGHDLEALLQESISRGVLDVAALTEQDKATIRLLSGDYADKRFEYVASGATYHLPIIELTEQVAVKLLSALKG